MFNLLQKLVTVSAPSGREMPLAAVIEELARPYGDVSSDTMGNLCVHKPGKGERVMLAAHMDSIGFIVTYVEESGYARVSNLGGIQIAAALGQRVVFNTGAIGVVCADSGVEAKDLSMDNLYIDTLGAKVRPGDTATFVGTAAQSGDYVVSQYLDDRLGCAVLLKLLMELKETDVELFCVFTAQEEVGLRGAGPAAFAIMPDYALAVDVTGTGDIPAAKDRKHIKLGGGPIVKIMDRSAIGHPAVLERIDKAAKAAGIEYQPLATRSGGTDTGAIAPSGSGIPAASIAVPMRYIHTPNEVSYLPDCEKMVELLKAILEG